MCTNIGCMSFRREMKKLGRKPSLSQEVADARMIPEGVPPVKNAHPIATAVVGQRFGHLTVLRLAHTSSEVNNAGHPMVMRQCSVAALLKKHSGTPKNEIAFLLEIA